MESESTETEIRHHISYHQQLDPNSRYMRVKAVCICKWESELQTTTAQAVREGREHMMDSERKVNR